MKYNWLQRFIAIFFLFTMSIFAHSFEDTPESTSDEMASVLDEFDEQAISSQPKVVEKKVLRVPAKVKTVGDIFNKYEKRDRIKIKKSRSSLPEVERLQRKREERVSLKRVKPSNRVKRYTSQGTTERELEEVTNKSIRQLFKLAERTKRSKNSGEIWLRLAEAYVDKARLIELQMQRRYDQEVIEYSAKRRRTRPKLNLKASRKYNKKAIRLYELFLKEFPRDKKVDQALFFLGHNSFQLGNSRQGKKYYRRLVKKFPNSSYVNNSNFALGEYYFEREGAKKALVHYKKVKKRSQLYNISIYKIAWCYYKLGQTKKALRSLQKLILKGRDADDDDNLLRISEEASKDVVVFYAPVGSPKRAQSYFTRLFGNEKAKELIIKLANYYKDTGDFSGARYVFRRLIAENPMSAKAFEYQYEIVKLYKFSGREKSFRKELRRWLKGFGLGSRWREYNSGNSRLVEASDARLEKVARNYLLSLHSSAQKTRSKFTQKQARGFYQSYLKVFTNPKGLGEVRFFYGELLFDMKKYSSAGYQYLWVFENRPQSKYFKKAILNAVLSFEKALPKAREIKKRVGKRKEPVELGQATKNFIKAVNNYIKSDPGSKKRIPLEYRQGSLYYYNNHYNKALPIFLEIVKRAPRSEYSEYAANLILDIYNIKKDYKGLDRAANLLLKIPGLKNTSLERQIRDIKGRSEFRNIKAVEASGNFVEAARSYERYAQNNKTKTLVVSALFNAAINYSKANQLNDSLRVYRLFFSKNPSNKKLRNQASQYMAINYEKVGDYRRAAQAYEKFYKENKKNPRALDFIYNAAIIRDGLGDSLLAIDNYDSYYKGSKSRDRREVLFLKAKHWERKGHYKTAKSLYDRYVKSNSSDVNRIMESLYKLADLNKRLRNFNRADFWYKRVIATYRSFSKNGKRVGVRYVAEAKFELIQKNEYKNFVNLKIPLNQKKQASALEKKIALFGNLKIKLKEIIKYGDAYQIVAALTLQGQALQHMAESIYKAPVPKGLKGADLRVYRKGVANLAKPFQDQVKVAYKAAVEKAIGLGVYSSWGNKAYERLSRLGISGFRKNYGQEALLTSSLDYLGISVGKNQRSLNKLYKKLGENPKDLKSLNGLVIYYIKKSQYGMAQIIFDRILKNHPKTKAISNNLGVNYLRRGEKRKAVAEFRQSIRASNFSGPAAANLASIILPHYDYEGALSLLENSYGSLNTDFGLEGDGLKIANNYALALWGSGKTSAAKKVFKRAVSKSSSMKILLNYAIILSEAGGDKSEALKYIRKIRLLSRNPIVLRKLRVLEKRLKGW